MQTMHQQPQLEHQYLTQPQSHSFNLLEKPPTHISTQRSMVQLVLDGEKHNDSSIYTANKRFLFSLKCSLIFCDSNDFCSIPKLSLKFMFHEGKNLTNAYVFNEDVFIQFNHRRWSNVWCGDYIESIEKKTD